MRSIFFVIIILATFFVSLPQLHAAEQAEIRLGSILILTGEGSSWGTAARNGIDLAVEKINAEGGISGQKIVVDHQDDQGDAKKAIAAFQFLTDVKKTRFIIGPNWSNTGLAIAKLADRKKVVMISPTLGLPEFNESSEFLFNVWPHDFLLSQQLADYVYEKGHRNIALVGAEEVWVKDQTAAFRKRYEELGGKISYLTEPHRSAADPRNDALKIHNNKDLNAMVSTTDGVIIGSLVAKALREVGSKLPMYSVTVDQAAIDAAQGGFEGMEFLTSLTPTAEFKKIYETRYTIGIDIGADSAYDAVMLLAQAMRESGSTDPEVVARRLAQVKSYSGASGELTSDGKRGFQKKYVVKRVVGGKAEDVVR